MSRFLVEISLPNLTNKKEMMHDSMRRFCGAGVSPAGLDWRCDNTEPVGGTPAPQNPHHDLD